MVHLSQKKLTVPVSPKFSKRLYRSTFTVKESKKENTNNKKHSKSYTSQKVAKRLTKPVSPKFQTRSRLKAKRKEIITEEAKTQVKVNQKPKLNRIVGVPPKKKLSVTIPRSPCITKPKNLLKKKTIESKRKEFELQARTFVATPFSKIPNRVPRRVKESSVTKPQPFQFSTDKRAQKRTKNSLSDDVFAVSESRRKRKESRKTFDMNLQAQPIRSYKPIVIKQSEKRLTTPQSPNFSKRIRR